MKHKHVFILIIIVIIISITHKECKAANYAEIVRDDNYLIYIDLSSLQDKGEYVVAWEKWFYRGEEEKREIKNNGKDFSHKLILSAYKKVEKERQTLGYFIYNKNGSVIKSNSWKYSPYDFAIIPPNSYGEFIWERVMSLSGNS